MAVDYNYTVCELMCGLSSIRTQQAPDLLEPLLVPPYVYFFWALSDADVGASF